eukprot:TRINITY_DN39399_c0_g1_i1.p1 TRINITY_DN39399_c0_g1~~TRINITY_DN39399_c0_g1_i1.p1  ORF type:complete len:595 (-),score=90.80 TRINITY_DN39399_c0_g1_i1:39-1823(-)
MRGDSYEPHGFAPSLPVTVANTFVHFPQAHCRAGSPSRVRSRSAPTKCVLAGDWPRIRTPEEQQGRRCEVFRRPQRKTRSQLDSLSIEDWVNILRIYGIDKLGCPESVRVAQRRIPALSQTAVPSALARLNTYLEDVSWDQLLLIVKHYATRAAESPPVWDDTGGASATASAFGQREGAAYVVQVCNELSGMQLRDVTVADSASAAWRAARFCEMLGCGLLWDEVMRRYPCNMLLLTARRAPLLDTEVQRIKSILGDRCRVESISANLEELEHLASGCHVLYVAGVHGRAVSSLRRLKSLQPSLAILNTCNSKRLARHLVACGIGCVSYWPAAVHDDEAVCFGVNFVNNLHLMPDKEAFAKAKAQVSCAERAPLLLSRQPDAANAPTVVLEIRGKTTKKSKLEGRVARVLWHTASTGWVKVQVDNEVLPWRVGHWRPATDDGGSSPSKADSRKVGEDNPASHETTSCPQAKAVWRQELRPGGVLDVAIDTDDVQLISKEKIGADSLELRAQVACSPPRVRQSDAAVDSEQESAMTELDEDSGHEDSCFNDLSGVKSAAGSGSRGFDVVAGADTSGFCADTLVDVDMESSEDDIS